jgi:hypothetical protein
VLGQRLGQLHGQAVHLQVVPVGVGREQLGGELADAPAHGGHLEGDHVGLAGVLPTEEVGQAQPPVPALPREGEPDPLGAVVVQHDQVVALADGREVAVDDGRLEDALGLEPVQPGAQPRPPLGLHQLLVRGSLAAAGAAQPPLAEEGRPLIEQ